MAIENSNSNLQFVPLHQYTNDITGQTFSRLTVLGYAGKRRWYCRCECGRIKKIYSYALKSGNTQSCGCLQKERAIAASLTHNQTHSPEYSVWSDMKTRCLNPKSTYYKNYGGRGIKICERWIDSFENFLADMGKRPSSNYSIDRIDNDGNYEPKNCQWKTNKEQNNNRRSNINFTYQNKTQTISQWCEQVGINYFTFTSRVRRGATIEQALGFVPVESKIILKTDRNSVLHRERMRKYRAKKKAD